MRYTTSNVPIVFNLDWIATPSLSALFNRKRAPPRQRVLGRVFQAGRQSKVPSGSNLQRLFLESYKIHVTYLSGARSRRNNHRLWQCQPIHSRMPPNCGVGATFYQSRIHCTATRHSFKFLDDRHHPYGIVIRYDASRSARAGN